MGYVSFPNFRILRTKTKKRMFKDICSKNMQSYLGMLKHCNGYKIYELILRNLGVKI